MKCTHSLLYTFIWLYQDLSRIVIKTILKPYNTWLADLITYTISEICSSKFVFEEKGTFKPKDSSIWNLIWHSDFHKSKKEGSELYFKHCFIMIFLPSIFHTGVLIIDNYLRDQSCVRVCGRWTGNHETSIHNLHSRYINWIARYTFGTFSNI